MEERAPKTPPSVIPESAWIEEPLFQKIQDSIPIATVDLIVAREREGTEILLIKRKIHPEEGKWCLIGGRILRGETIRDAILRQSKIELGVSVEIMKPWNAQTPLAVFSDPVSDAQKHFVCLVYPVWITGGDIGASGPEYGESRWFAISNLPTELGFNHADELRAFIEYHTQPKNPSL